jgi:hypothetical protein
MVKFKSDHDVQLKLVWGFMKYFLSVLVPLTSIFEITLMLFF